MPVRIHYALADGQIEQLYEANMLEFLDWQTHGEASGALTVLDPIAVSPALIMERYYVDLATLTLTPKAVATLSASLNPFPADGLTICSVTLVPFAPCTLRVNEQDVTLSPEDPTLALTSEVARRFRITFVPQAQLWADTLTVEAL